MEQEIWKDINGFEGYYQISNFGRVRSLDRIINGQRVNGKIIKPFVTKIGYIQTALYKNNKSYKKYIHRLIMETFNPVDNMENLDVDHIDRDKTNNAIENLRWVTHKENMHSWNPPAKRPRCVDCGVEIGLHSTRCVRCSSIHINRNRTSNRHYNHTNNRNYNCISESVVLPNKDEIYKMALSGMNVTEIAEHFGMKRQTFGRACRKLGIVYKTPKPPKEKKEPVVRKKVKRIDKTSKEEVVFENSTKAAESVSKSTKHIIDVCNRKRKSAYGYYWEYID